MALCIVTNIESVYWDRLLATVITLCGCLRARGIDEVCDLGSTNPKLGQGSADAVQRHARLPSRGDRLARPGGWSPWFAAPAVWGTLPVHLVLHLVHIEAHQAYHDLTTKEQGRKRTHALDP
jgi:hypothetical protein